MSVTLPTPPAPPPGAVPPLPADVRAFADRHGIGEHVAATARLLRESFPPAGEVSFRLFVDPETEDENPWTAVVVAVRSRLTVPELLRAADGFYDRWIPATPPPARDLIIPSYSPA
jgi:hypothetical protein